MNVLLLSRYSRLGASSRLRTLQYLPELEASGIRVTVLNLFDDHYLQTLYAHGTRSPAQVLTSYMRRLLQLLGSYRYDLLWIECELFPGAPAWFERLLGRLGKPFVVDYDDAVFHRYDLSGNPLVRRFMAGKIDVVMQAAAHVVAGNEYLAQRARAAGAARVSIIPTVVDHHRYGPRQGDDHAALTIGWMGSPSTQKYVVSIRDALATICQRHAARLLLVGASPQIAAELHGIDVDVVPWREESEAQLIRQMDIGIMPLLDTPWEQGKCGYKLIQYMACAVPVVASPVGVNVDIVKGSGSGLLASSTAQWCEALHTLAASPAVRQRFGAAGWQAVQSRYSLQAQASILRQVLEQAASR
ncbi:glycosyltransferase family 4 protein [Pseudomonas sp. NW5]|uniref:glycosyltransferase family 4 protein n=1 Tax=Pseudomonas sp. NW5 TaxID=2934934 RepID=UPI0020209878|nr:glycosyltransferase family 4 protein [Pseudomonas sp. NW5]MCL7462271.1 glycosyltransferase family 4 protein [Pseudomonas sp. NW5]